MADTQRVTLEQALDLARYQMQAGNFRVAEVALGDILKAVPDHVQSRHYLGLARYYLGNLPGAIEALRETVANPAATAECWCNFGVMLSNDGRHDEALAAFDRAIALDPAYPDPWWNRSNALWLAGRFEEAEQAGRDATRKKPDAPEAWLNLGMALVSLERREEAIACWEKAAELRPDFALAWNNLGNALREMGRPAEAEVKCRKALECDPANVQAMNNLGNALLDQGQLEEAGEQYRRAVSLKPDYAEAHNNLAVCNILLARYDEAAVSARYAALFQEGYAEAHMNLSGALRAVGKFEEAEKALQEALFLKPDSAEIKIDLADMLLMQDRQAEADLVLDEIRRMNPEGPRVWMKLSGALERAGRAEESMEAALKAVELAPAMPDAHVRLGQVYHFAGKIDAAEASYRRAAELQPSNPLIFVALAELSQAKGDMQASRAQIAAAKAIAPRTPEIYHTLSKLKKFTAGDEDFKAMLAMEPEIRRRGPEAEAALHFALFSACEDIGDHERAFAHLKKANDCKRAIIPYDTAAQAEMFRAIKEGYTADTAAQLAGRGDPSAAPVFILGMPRSGTTLTEQIIAAHPDVVAGGELHAFPQVMRECNGRLTAENCAGIGARYVAEVKKLDPSSRALRITDKMPGNFLHLGQIVSALPNARIIHCRRDPVDTALSCYKQNFARGQYWSYNLEELGAYYKFYDDLMAHWRAVLPGKFLEIDYEETVGDLESQARKLIDYVGLPWNDACLSPHEHRRVVLTASKTQVIRPVYKTSVNAWKRYESGLEPLLRIIAV